MMKLPKKPSDLIKLALSDLAKAVENPNVRVNMTGVWCEKTARGNCYVCLAGAVMLNSLGNHTKPLLKNWGTVSPSDLAPDMGEAVRNALYALNEFRMGLIADGLRSMDIVVPDGIRAFHPVTSYDYDPSEWKKDMKSVVRELKRFKL